MAAETGKYDVIVIGAGHNGLTCAAYLAAAGLQVKVLERRGVVGGAAVTEEFHPGFKNSVYAYSISLLNPRVIRDLNLSRHGLTIFERPARTLSLLENDHLLLSRDEQQARREIARFSKRDARVIDEFEAQIGRVALAMPDLEEEIEPSSAYERVSDLDLPLLVLWGDLDFPYIQERCRYLVDTIPAARGQVIPGTAHLPNLEQPRIVNERIRDHLGK